ncbi:MAG: tRNA pseudouridine(38-40) synthase TruA, partial [Bacteroidota bacterium]
MPRYFLELAYRGTEYHGWQIQPNARTVQATIQDSLNLLTKGAGELTGCGRTDTGVHASLYYAHVDMQDQIQDIQKLVFQLNAVLPIDIRIRNIHPVAEDAHARFDARHRAYGYYLFTKPGPFLQGLGLPYSGELNIQAMNDAAARCIGEHDFGSFSKNGTQTGHNRCAVTSCCWSQLHGYIKFDVAANRFLRGMVRALTGTLLNVGRGTMSIDAFAEVLSAKDRRLAGESVSPEGLFLEAIH